MKKTKKLTKKIGLPETIKIKWAGYPILLKKEEMRSTYDSPGDPGYFGTQNVNDVSINFELMRFTYGHEEKWELFIYFNGGVKGSALAGTPQKASKILMNILEKDYKTLNYFFGSRGN